MCFVKCEKTKKLTTSEKKKAKQRRMKILMQMALKYTGV